VTGYEAAWRPAGGNEWTTVVSGAATRLQIDDLADEEAYLFKVRATCAAPAGGDPRCSAWTAERTCVPGAVTAAPAGAQLGRPPIRAMVTMVFASLGAAIKARQRSRG
jgi:hypothetical protein